MARGSPDGTLRRVGPLAVLHDEEASRTMHTQARGVFLAAVALRTADQEWAARERRRLAACEASEADGQPAERRRSRRWLALRRRLAVIART